MKKIERYIIEKLKINKNSKPKYNLEDLKIGSKILPISFEVSTDSCDVRLYYPFILKKITKTKLTYLTADQKEITQDISLNSNDYYQTSFNRRYAVYLTPKEGIKFLKKLYENDRKLEKDDLLKYFDKECVKDKVNLYYNYDNDFIKSVLYELQEDLNIHESYINEKLKINKDSKIEDKDYLSNIYNILQGSKTDKIKITDKAEELIKTWLTDFNKRLFCYIYNGVKPFYENVKIDKSIVSINYIDLDILTKAFKLASTRVYGNVKEDDLIESIEWSQDVMVIEFKQRTWGILFEKSKI